MCGLVRLRFRRDFSFKLSMILAAILCWSIISSVAHAQVTVSAVILTFKAKQRPVQTISVGNGATTPTYVVAHVEKVLDPEKGGNTSEPSDDILISPKTFSIEPGGQRSVRLLLRTPSPEKETVYRALFVPQDRGFGQEISREVQGRRASIRVLTGMGTLVFVEPSTSTRDFSWIRSPTGITFTNNGTLHEELSNVHRCPTNGGPCSSLEGKRVYAASSYELKVRGEDRVSFLMRTGSAGEFQQGSIEPFGAGVGTPSTQTKDTTEEISVTTEGDE